MPGSSMSTGIGPSDSAHLRSTTARKSRIFRGVFPMNSPRSVFLALAAFVAIAFVPRRQQPAEVLEAAAIKSLTWRSLGPANAAGRVSVVVGIPGQPDTFYVAGANGGIIKTTNGGTTYTQIFDDQNVISIGAIA